MSSDLKKRPSLGTPHRECKPFFLNIVLLNKEEIVAKKVEEKTGAGFFGRAAAFAANKMITDEKITTNLAEALIESVNKATSELGINADMEVKFQQGPFVVIRVQVTEVDPLQLILSAKGPEFASNFTTLMTTVEALGMKETVQQKVDEKIYTQVNEGMINKFKLLIPQKMAEKGVMVECHATPADQEAEVFFDILATVNAQQAAAASK